MIGGANYQRANTDTIFVTLKYSFMTSEIMSGLR